MHSGIQDLWRLSTAWYRSDRLKQRRGELLAVQGIGSGIVKEYGAHIFRLIAASR